MRLCACDYPGDLTSKEHRDHHRQWEARRDEPSVDQATLINDRVAALERFMLALAPLVGPLLDDLEADGVLTLSDTQRAEISFWRRYTGNVHP